MSATTVDMALMCYGAIPIPPRHTQSLEPTPLPPSYGQIREHRQRKVFEFIKDQGRTITRREIMDMNGSGDAVSLKDLEVLSSKGLITKTREGPVWRYSAVEGAQWESE